jgi:cytochrome b6-f complex iron-sulfur subunit
MTCTRCDEHSRRTFCARAVALASLGGILGAMVEGCSTSPTSPTSAASLPSVTGTRVSAGVTVTIDATSPLASVGGAALVQASGVQLLVSRTAQNSFVALTAICTHQTCTITGFASNTYVCPCHGSTFDLNGRVLGGPAPSPLHEYTTQFANNVLTITA